MNQEQIEVNQNLIGKAIIKVIGVGGGGSNAVKRMRKHGICGVEYLAVNTDQQALERMGEIEVLRVGDNNAKGMGVGGDPTRGKECHEEDRGNIEQLIGNSDMVFIAAGMGGGTGTGGAPVVADVAKKTGALTVGVVTKPFDFEGYPRMTKAEKGIEDLQKYVDTLIVIPNQKLLDIEGGDIPMETAFEMADNVLKQGIDAIAELILTSGVINLDFADVRAVMQNAGPAWMAIGHGKGPNKAAEAVEAAIKSPLLEVDIDGARGIILNVSGGDDLSINATKDAANMIKEIAHPDVNLIFGHAQNPALHDEMKLTIIATGFPMAMQMAGLDSENGERLNTLELSEDEVKNLGIPPFLRKHPNARRVFQRDKM